jgi:hypothetical protein
MIRRPKAILAGVTVAAFLLAGPTAPHAHGGGHGGGHAGHGGHSGSGGHGGAWRHHHGHGNGAWRAPVFGGIAGAFLGGWPVWYPLDLEPPYAGPFPLYAPPGIEDFAPSPYIQQPPRGYWYYCWSSQGYYPFVGECPDGWIPVPPEPGPP